MLSNMSQVDVAGQKLPMRSELACEIELAWERLAAPGTWWTGEQRLAIAAEARQAQTCRLCRERAQALSPHSIEGRHDDLSLLPGAAVEAVHRLRTDAGRLTRSWLDRLLAGGEGEPPPTEAEYVEIVAVVAIVTALDTLDLTVGRPRRDLPMAKAGAPGGRRFYSIISTHTPRTASYSNPIAVLANTHMLSSRSSRPVSSVRTRSIGPHTARHVCPAASP